jgi:hypothetical protein
VAQPIPTFTEQCADCADNGLEVAAVYPGNEFGCPPRCVDCANRSIDRALGAAA